MIKRKNSVGKRQFYRRVAAATKKTLQDLSTANCEDLNSAFSFGDTEDSLSLFSHSVSHNCMTTQNFTSNVNEQVRLPDTYNNVINYECNANENDLMSNLNVDSFEHSADIESTSVENIPRPAVLDNKSNLSSSLLQWSLKYHVSQVAVTSLLHILSPFHPDLPLDSRTLLRTPTSMIETVLENGTYCHIGLKNGLNNILSKFKNADMLGDSLNLSFNVDGVSPFHSSSVQIWPISCLIKNFHVRPFFVGIFRGNSKPRLLETYLDEFITELFDVMQNKFYFNNKLFEIKIHSFICDAPARAYLKCIKTHNGYSSCDKCTEVGEYHGRVVFPTISARPRTNISFESQDDEDHHVGKSPLLRLKIGMVSDFPNDYMHSVCLGVTKKILNLWIGAQKSTLLVKLNAQSVSTISKRLASLKPYFPVEINRKPRKDPIHDLPRWKATEFRSFLVYVGPVVIKGIVDPSIYEHFLLLHCAITILLSEYHIKNIGLNLARELLENFVKHSKKIYGIEFLVYNVHSLIHLTDDVEIYGPLDNFSAFPFESNFSDFKTYIRSPHKPLQQIVRRIQEQTHSDKIICDNKNDLKPHMQHVSGPVLNSLNISQQFRKVNFKGFLLSTNNYAQADSYFISKESILVQIQNIVVDRENNTLIIGKKFNSHDSYYKYPFASSYLDIFLVCGLSEILDVWSFKDIKAKAMVIPSENSPDHWVCFPLVHTLC